MYFHNYCATNDLLFCFFFPHASLQNNRVEIKIHTINKIIRTILAYASVPPLFWHHALQMATHLHNIIHQKIMSNISPTRLLYHRDPSYTHLRIFGCLC